MVGRMSFSTAATVAVAAPGCLLAVVSALALALGIVNRDPVWSHQTLTLSEAASVDDEAEVVRLIERGADANAPYNIRAGFPLGVPARLTPIDAAVAAKNASMVATLLTHGAVLDAGAWNRLRCSTEDDDVARILDGHRPAGATVQCADGPVPRS